MHMCPNPGNPQLNGTAVVVAGLGHTGATSSKGADPCWNTFR